MTRAPQYAAGAALSRISGTWERLGNDLSLATIARSVQQLESALQVEIDSERHVRIRVDLPLGSDS